MEKELNHAYLIIGQQTITIAKLQAYIVSLEKMLNEAKKPIAGASAE